MYGLRGEDGSLSINISDEAFIFSSRNDVAFTIFVFGILGEVLFLITSVKEALEIERVPQLPTSTFIRRWEHDSTSDSDIWPGFSCMATLPSSTQHNLLTHPQRRII